MKKLMFAMLFVPLFGFAQTTGQQVENAIDNATDLLNIVSGHEPQADYNKIIAYLAANKPGYICANTFAQYKKYEENLCVLDTAKKTVFIYYFYKEKLSRVPVLMDGNCASCKVNGSVTYDELLQKALDSEIYASMLSSYKSYLPYLIYNKDYISWIVKTNGKK